MAARAAFQEGPLAIASHFLLTAIGSYGDVHPMVGLGAQLVERGHRVSLVTNPYFAEVVERAGLELLPMSTAEEYLRLIDVADIWHPVRSVPHIFREAIIGYMQPMYELIQHHYKPGETVVAAHVLDVASRVFRETAGARVATVTFSPQAMWSRHRPPVMGGAPVGPHLPRWWNEAIYWFGNRTIIEPVLRRPLNAWRAELGAPPVGRLFPDWWFASDANICLFPEWFAPLQPDWPRPIEAVGFPLWDAGDTTPLDSEVAEFLANGDQPVVFTAGTANMQATSLFRTAVEVCKRLDRRGVLLTKFAQQTPSDLPTGVRHFKFVPLTRLLPHCAAFVHHGGIGSSSQALAAGIPQLIRPLAFDQFDNAARLMRLGVAEKIAPQRFDAPRVADALDRLTGSEAVQQSCQRWAAKCDRAALERACEVLERVARRE